MQQPYSHPWTGERFSFQAPTTRQSILAAAREFTSIAKPEIFSSNWFQLGRILRTSEGFWVPPPDAKGQPITGEQTLKRLLTKDAKVKGIYLLNQDGAFAPYESFQQGVQEARQFAEGGLARALEHTPERVAKNLEAMARTYPGEVNVFNFDPPKEPTLTVASLGSDGVWYGGGLVVFGGNWYGGGGFAFGVRQ